MIQSGTTPFRPRARLIRLLGEELISDEVMAIAELVKNAYDADATRVTVRFSQLSDPEAAMIEIEDDGHGMSLQTLLEAWLEPATAFKRGGAGRKVRTIRGRYPLGEKGVGRFAADKLGSELELISRTQDAPEEVRLVVQWEEFAPSEYLDEVSNEWETRRPLHFRRKAHGTLLRMRRLRLTWREELLERVRDGLVRLISPTARGETFQMVLEAHEFPEISGAIEDVLLAAAPYRLSGRITALGYLVPDGGGESIDLRRLAGEHFRAGSGRLRDPACGPFTLTLSAWDLDALGDRGVRLSRPLRALLRKRSGVSIYRDGFRVAPYGDPGDDWLELNRRRVNNPTQRLSTNQLVGLLEITQEGNPTLRDRTSREGLVDTPGVHDLRALVVAAISRLEDERYLRRKQASSPPPDGDDDPVLARLERATGAGNGVALKEAAREYRKFRAQAEQRERVLLRMAGAGAASESILTQLNGAVAELAASLPRLKRFAGQHGAEQINRINRRLREVRVQLDALERFNASAPPSRSTFSVRALVDDACSIYMPLLARAGVDMAVTGARDVNIEADRGSVLQALLHVLENAILAAADGRRRREIVLHIDGNPAAVRVRDSGVAVPANRRQAIFDPFYSARGAEGLGLYFARELLRSDGRELTLAPDGKEFILHLA